MIIKWLNIDFDAYPPVLGRLGPHCWFEGDDPVMGTLPGKENAIPWLMSIKDAVIIPVRGNGPWDQVFIHLDFSAN